MPKKIDIGRYTAFNKLIDQGLYIYPIAPNSKAPFKGSHGYNDASNDRGQLDEWINLHGTDINIGIDLKRSGVIALDIDTHTGGANGYTALNNVFKVVPNAQAQLSEHEANLYSEHSASGNGFHMYFKYEYEGAETDFKGTNEYAGLEILTTSSIIAPSKIDGNRYESKQLDILSPWTNLAPAPKWMIEFVKGNIPGKQAFKPITTQSNINRGGKYKSAEFLEALIDGAPQGERNNWITSQIGVLFKWGMDADKILEFMYLINQNYVTPPLSDDELITIFKSVAKTNLKGNG